jgi:hypothetical protein
MTPQIQWNSSLHIQWCLLDPYGRVGVTISKSKVWIEISFLLWWVSHHWFSHGQEINSWDSKPKKLTTPQDAEIDKAWVLESAAWYRGEFGGHMQRKDKGKLQDSLRIRKWCTIQTLISQSTTWMRNQQTPLYGQGRVSLDLWCHAGLIFSKTWVENQWWAPAASKTCVATDSPRETFCWSRQEGLRQDRNTLVGCWWGSIPPCSHCLEHNFF